MPRKPEQHPANDTSRQTGDLDRVSRTDVRREQRRNEDGLLALATKLAGMKPRQLQKLELAETHLEIIDEIRVIESAAARNRAIKRLRADLRDVDLAALNRRISALTGPKPGRGPDEVMLWHARLLGGNDADLNAFMDRCPDADRAQLRMQVRRTVRAKPPDQKRASLKLEQALRAAMRTTSNAHDEPSSKCGVPLPNTRSEE